MMHADWSNGFGYVSEMQIAGYWSGWCGCYHCVTVPPSCMLVCNYLEMKCLDQKVSPTLYFLPSIFISCFSHKKNKVWKQCLNLTEAKVWPVTQHEESGVYQFVWLWAKAWTRPKHMMPKESVVGLVSIFCWSFKVSCFGPGVFCVSFLKLET